MKKAILIFTTLMMLVSCLFSSACSGSGNKDNKENKTFQVEEKASGSASYMSDLKNEASSDAYGESNGNKRFISGNYALELSTTDEYSLKVVNLTTGKSTFGAKESVRIYVNDGTLSEQHRASYSSKYTSVEKASYGYKASCEITTVNGTTYLTEDNYYLLKGEFVVDRYVKVTKTNSKDLGFESEFSVYAMGENTTLSNFDRFVPAMLYKDEVGLLNDPRYTSVAFAYTDLEENFVRETYSTMPMTMARNVTDGEAVTVQHLKPDISSPYVGGFDGEVDIRHRNGSIGYYYGESLGMGYCFPCKRTPKMDSRKFIQLYLYSPSVKNFTQSYSISIIPSCKDNYNDSMIDAYKRAYNLEDPSIPEMDVELVYDQTMQIFYEKYREFGTSSEIAAGVPFSMVLPDANNDDGYDFAGGFVGQQVPIAYHFLRYGYLNGDAEVLRRGKVMMNFWTSDTIMGGTIPVIWWDAGDVSTGGKARDIGNYVRYFADIAEGMLDAYILSKEYGEENTQWYNAIIKYANLFLNKQMNDGTWYRCYDKNGNVRKNVGTYDTNGDSKMNTSIPVRFLGKMYELTGEAKYRTAALKAAKYIYDNCYVTGCKYFGGTADNNLIVDKEGGIYAAYCYNTAYELETDPVMKANYFKAAEQAIIYTMSYTYVYDFCIPNLADDTVDTTRNPFENGGIKGFSVIGTAVVAADNYNNVMYYELFKMAVQRDGDAFLMNLAKFIQNATKSSSDFNGRMGYAFNQFNPEASRLVDFQFRSVNVWLPWSGIVNIEPMVYLERAFGTKDVYKITDSIETLKQKLDEFGLGGKKA